ncbi:hypothetical protein D3C87_1293890 [compost metagenome]
MAFRNSRGQYINQIAYIGDGLRNYPTHGVDIAMGTDHTSGFDWVLGREQGVWCGRYSKAVEIHRFVIGFAFNEIIQGHYQSMIGINVRDMLFLGFNSRF